MPRLISNTSQNSNTCYRASAGGSFLSGFFGKAAVARSLRSLTPRQLGDEDEVDEDVKAEMDRVANGGADNDVVKAGDGPTSMASRHLLVGSSY